MLTWRLEDCLLDKALKFFKKKWKLNDSNLLVSYDYVKISIFCFKALE